jgi:hypothetical protein
LSYAEKKALPFIAAATLFAMLGGFLLPVLLPYNAILAWSVFVLLEGAIAAVIARRLIEIRRTIHAKRLGASRPET